jgi:uncharacterized membrane protein
MMPFIRGNRRILTSVLCLAGIAVMVAYALCLGSCSYLKGDLLGVDLKLAGIFYMAVILVLALFGRSFLCMLLLAFGLGGEIFLITYQIRAGVYCPYCLAFAATVLGSFVVHFDSARKGTAVLAAGGGLVFFLLAFSGTTTPSAAVDSPIPAYGRGPVEVRIYTDYFCEPCRAEEAEVTARVAALVERGLIRVTFVDTPVHDETVLYAGRFLSALNAEKDGGLPLVLRLRAALFEAAGQGIRTPSELDAFLKRKGIPLKPLDTAPAFKAYGNLLKEDRILSTPTCVIVGPGGKRTFTGRQEIIKALQEIKGGS